MRNVFRLNTKMSALAWLFVAISLCYLLQNIASVWFNSTVFFREISLTTASIKKWNILPLLTYPFIHEGLLSLFLNGIALLLLGSAIERRFGAKRLLAVFFTSSICGGVVWTGLHWTDSYFLAGSLAACAGLLSYF
jgi:membrane associated rhomboid family serine protease